MSPCSLLISCVALGVCRPSLAAATVLGQSEKRSLSTSSNEPNQTFDFNLYARYLHTFGEGALRIGDSRVSESHRWSPRGPHCDKGVRATDEISVQDRHVSVSYPGGITQRRFGSDLSKFLMDVGSAAKGTGSAALVLPVALQRQALALGSGLVQSVVAAAIHIIPPMIPPPVWVNQPLPCAPMVAGHNCFGAVLYPITLADFFLADVTDAMLDGYIAGFPNTYASKVGKTTDLMYKGCFAAYMSMQCSSIFPRCSAPLSREEPLPIGGRVPTCLHLCIVPLVLCPGFWISDIIGSCQMISVPPVCTQAFYWNLWRLPPQYVTFDEAEPFPEDCPPPDTDEDGIDSSDDPALYDIPASISRHGSELAAPARP